MDPRERLKPFVTNLDRPVYALRNLPPEVVAVLFAYVSRSAASFRDNLLKLMEEGDVALGTAPGGDPFRSGRASAFHEKWVLGYGHASVAEHAELKLAIEDLSILAAKAVEDARLASFTEKSSRYQVFDAGRFHWPAELAGHELEPELRALVDELFAAYAEWYGPLKERLAAEYGRPEGLSERAWQGTLHAAACDGIRYLLPAGALTSLGMSINARGAAHLVRKLRAHPLQELRALGDAIEGEAGQVVPVLLKHAQPSVWQMAAPLRLENELEQLGVVEPEPWSGSGAPPLVRLLDCDSHAVPKICADWIFQSGACSLREARRRAEVLEPRELHRLLCAALDGMDRHDWPPRAFEQAALTAEFCVDYGAWRDLQRHRLLSPTNPPLGCRWGWETPPELALLPGAMERFEALMGRARGLWERLAGDQPLAAAYCVPMAFRVRFAMRMNLRETEHLVRLRSSVAGHLSYRRVAWALHEELARVWPELSPWLRVDRRPAAFARAHAEQARD
jgi:thymidylate synthase ThyX